MDLLAAPTMNRMTWLFVPILVSLGLGFPARGNPPVGPSATSTTPLGVLRAVDEEPRALAVSPDGSQLVSASGFELLLWDLKSSRPLRSLELPNLFRHYTACAFSPDGSTIAAASADGKIAFWQTSTGVLLKSLPSEDWMYDCAFSADLKTAFCVYQSDKVTFRNLETGKVIWSSKKQVMPKVCAFASAASRALSVDQTGSVTLWDTAKGKELRSFENIGCRFHRPVAISPDGRIIAAATYDDTESYSIHSTTILLVDATSGKTLRTLEGHTESLTSLEFSPDGSALASCSEDYTLKLWSTGTGTLIRTYRGHLRGECGLGAGAERRGLHSILLFHRRLHWCGLAQDRRWQHGPVCHAAARRLLHCLSQSRASDGAVHAGKLLIFHSYRHAQASAAQFHSALVQRRQRKRCNDHHRQP